MSAHGPNESREGRPVEDLQILCPECEVDTGSIERLGIHLLDKHPWISGAPAGRGRDQVEDYCRESATRNLLNKEAEVALGRLIQADGPRADQAKKILVESNLKLVVALVRKYAPGSVVTVEYRRGSDRQNASVTLAADAK